MPARPDVSAPNIFAGLLQSGGKTAEAGGEWSKVEKRKAKKARKAEEKTEVLVFLFFLFNFYVLTVDQNSPPRFFYVNSEMVKRREAVTIGVRLPGLCNQCVS